ncbi:MAG: FMN-binding protein [Turicibacter sp.]|nr:FMN-binding protein [Turicibacter sp.]
MKRIIASLVAVLLFTATFIPTLPIYAQTTLVIDGESNTFDSQNVGGHYMLPIRAVMESVGIDVTWNDGQIILTRGADNLVTLNVGSATFVANGVEGTLPVPVQILVDGTAFAVVGPILEGFGHTVEGGEVVVVPAPMPTADPVDGVEIVTVTTQGYIGPITVQVSLQGTTVIAVEVTEHTETPLFFGMASPATENAIVAAGTHTGIIANDVATGATYTAAAILETVRQAIEQVEAAAAVPDPDPPAPPEEAVTLPADLPPVAAGVPANLPVSTGTFTPGTQTVTVPGWQEAPMTVDVTFSENQITDITIVSHGESMYGSGWAFRALPGVPDQIFVRQSTLEIDEFTGATVTRDAVIAAVEEAIELAGASPADLEPQFIDAPLAGDNFIPGFIEVVVPASTMAVDGTPFVEGQPRMLYSLDTDMNLRLSFGRNEFHLHSGGAFGLGQGGGGHGESVTDAGGISGGTWGGWWFRQVVNHQVNDRQTTQGIDIFTGATYSAAAIIWGVEQGIVQQGGNPAALAARTTPRTQIQRNPGAEPDAPFFAPGVYTVTVEGWGGPMEIRITLDRTTIRRIEILEHNETPEYLEMVWGAPADNLIRDAIFEAQFAGLDEVDVVTGATVTAQAIVDAVRQAIDLAWID